MWSTPLLPFRPRTTPPPWRVGSEKVPSNFCMHFLFLNYSLLLNFFFYLSKMYLNFFLSISWSLYLIWFFHILFDSPPFSLSKVSLFLWALILRHQLECPLYIYTYIYITCPRLRNKFIVSALLCFSIFSIYIYIYNYIHTHIQVYIQCVCVTHAQR